MEMVQYNVPNAMQIFLEPFKNSAIVKPIVGSKTVLCQEVAIIRYILADYYPIATQISLEM